MCTLHDLLVCLSVHSWHFSTVSGLSSILKTVLLFCCPYFLLQPCCDSGTGFGTNASCCKLSPRMKVMAANATGKQSLETKAGQVTSTDDSVMSTKSHASSNSRRRRRSSASRRASSVGTSAADGDVIWVNGRPLTMPTSSAQNFTSPPQQVTNLNNPTQGYTGTTEDAINFSLPKHMQDIVRDDVEITPSDLQEVAGNPPTPNKHKQVHQNPLLPHLRSMPRSGQGPAWAGPMGLASQAEPAADIKAETSSAGSQSQSKAKSESTVSAGLGAKLKAQLAALTADSEQENKPEVEMTSTSQDPPASRQEADAQHQTPFSGNLVSPPDSVEGDDAAGTASDPGEALASEQTWTAGMGQDLGKELQARLARASKAPTTARPPVHRSRPSSEQTWSAGQGASLGAQLKQQLAQLRSAGSNDLAPAVERGSEELQQPTEAGPRDADKFPAKPTRLPWTAPIPESSENTWTDSVGRRVRQQFATIRGSGNDVSVPPPRREQRPSLFDLFSDQPMSERPTWSAGIGEKMRKQMEEVRKRDIEDSARTTSSSSQDQESTRSPKNFVTNSLPSNLPASEQTWTAGMGHAARKELLQRRSVIQRNLGSPDIPDDHAQERQPDLSMSQSAKDESSRGGKEYLQQDSLAFHHLEEIPHVSTLHIIVELHRKACIGQLRSWIGMYSRNQLPPGYLLAYDCSMTSSSRHACSLQSVDVINLG